MSDQFTVAQVTQLHEIERARIKRGQPGLKHDLQEFIRRQNDHGVVMLDGNRKAAREAQAKRYWDSGVAPALGYHSFKDYLQHVPVAPNPGLTNLSMLHPWLLLIEPRIGFARLCQFAKVDCRMGWVKERNGDAPGGHHPFWIAFDDGRRERGTPIAGHLTRDSSVSGKGFTAFIGVCAALQKRDIVGQGIGDTHDPYYLYLIGTRNHDAPDVERGHMYANLQTAPNDDLQIWESPQYQGCAAYGIPTYVRY